MNVQRIGDKTWNNGKGGTNGQDIQMNIYQQYKANGDINKWFTNAMRFCFVAIDQILQVQVVQAGTKVFMF